MRFPFGFSCAVVGLALPLLASAQAAPATHDDGPQVLGVRSFPDEAAVIEDLSVKVRFENDGKGTVSSTVRGRIQSEAAVQQSGLVVLPYASAVETLDIKYVRVRKPDGTIIETPLDTVQDLTSEVARSAPMYTDQHEKHVAVRGLSVGDIMEYSAVTTVLHPLAPGQFWFSINFVKNVITIHESVEIDVPRDRVVRVVSPVSVPVVTDNGDRRFYRFDTAQLKTESEPDRWEAAVKGIPPPDVQVSSFASWDEVASWYDSDQRVAAQPTPDIRAKALELTRNAKDDTEKIRNIYDYVSTKFRYISVSLGQGRYAPHPATEVMANQFGDCKDKHTLIAALLQSVGIASYPALIGTGAKIDPSLPTPASFDHVITVIPRADSFQWLDTTPGVAPYGFLWLQLRDRLALVVLNDGHSKLVKTPAQPPTPSFLHFTMTATIDASGTLEGHARAETRGDEEVVLRLAFQNVPNTKWKDLVQSLSASMGFGGTVDAVFASVPEETEKPFWFTYTYTRPEYGDWANRRVILPFPVFGLPDLTKEEVRSTAAVPLQGAGNITFDAHLTLPAGYTTVPPPALEEKRDFADYQSSYSFESGTITGTRRLRLLIPQVAAGQRSQYQSFYKAIEDDFNQWINLAVSPTGLGLKLSRNSEAQRLFADGLQSYQLGAPWAASKSLESAVRLDPDWVDAWLLLAKARLMSSSLDSAKVAYHRVFSLDPTNLEARMEFATALAKHYDLAEAVVAWQDVLKLAPTNAQAPIALADLLVATNRFAEARPMAEKSVEQDDKIGSYHVTLGNVYVHLNEDEIGSAEFQKALELSPGPKTLNSIARILSEADRLLPDAQRYAELAVQQTEAATFNVKLGSPSEEGYSVVGALVASWDTLGWVYFRLGNLSDAERYLAAAWSFAPDPAVAEHLAQAYEKQGRKTLALHTYALALGALPPNGDPQLRARLSSRLFPGNAATPLAKLSPEQDQRLKWVPVKFKGGPGKSAAFVLLFSKNSRVPEVRFLRGDESFREAAAAIAAANFDVLFPDDAPTRIVRWSTLACLQGPAKDCSLTLDR
jgi:tetratricopeptide (TPR) repeat protein